ncbi:hypothetical protein FC83_GL001660 [Agrilactobacillus composti DSM 18527 = JCM 14202]|uniref:YbaK/aminoacyl-tRNA synthetase-associated domain-containing protein n=1 Tax=Agrilactobacillus composti DSM 18527 = JCM 14202 TaxID=1423734 RepID=X0PCT9_9LACO|nr:YbaK/EbsC family protein [Agrilactobacillus composti]KRM30526.1 hypothetical protein FC83_GL001660 [Agrilactobacillus composti DSM 18527 = JCM 14202]GAF38408.1 tRNA proofreading protein [Agrilactobacillus composti DSM 18527 = JCM 14202]
MSVENVKAYFKQLHLPGRVVEHAAIGDTVAHAAQLLHCQPAEIAKSMTFLVHDQPVLIVMAGDAKVDNKKYKQAFATKAKMIPGDEVAAIIGHEPGAVCPFAVKDDVAIYLDDSLKRFETVYTAGGSTNSTIGLSIPELAKYTHFLDWVNVGKGWQPVADD